MDELPCEASDWQTFVDRVKCSNALDCVFQHVRSTIPQEEEDLHNTIHENFSECVEKQQHNRTIVALNLIYCGWASFC